MPGRASPAPEKQPGGLSARPRGLRILAGCVIVMLCAAAVTVTFVLEQVHSLQQALGQTRSVHVGRNTLAQSAYGGPETFLLVGNDQRNHTTTAPVLPHSNEMLLVRIDPGRPYISMMSIPRELEVTITPPGQAPVTTRLNYAYTAGGIPLLVSTIRRVTGLGVNHVVVIDFKQFRTAVDEIGCVYATIDRRYFHVNVPGGEQYQEINLQAGYQDLCGTQALQFVSYRHGDTSLVRDARDQSFLLAAKQQYGPSLADNISKFERIFGRTVQTDPGLRSTSGLLNLAGTMINVSSLRVRQVHFQANLVPPGATPCACVTASPAQIASSVDSFLHGHAAAPGPGGRVVARSVARRHALARLPLTPTGATELAAARRAAARLPFALEYPTVQDTGGAVIPVAVRDYLIHSPDGAGHPIYTAVFSGGQLGSYYDVQGTTWMTPPLVAKPDQTVSADGRRFRLFYSGQHLQTVAWAEHGALYWVQNSLTDTLSNGELLAIAEQSRPVARAGADLSAPARLRLRAAAAPKRTVAGVAVEPLQTAGAAAALLSLLALPVLGVLILGRRRDLRDLRTGLGELVQRRAQLEHRLSGAPRRSPVGHTRVP